MTSGEVEVNWFNRICVMLEEKFNNDSLRIWFSIAQDPQAMMTWNFSQ